MIAAPAGDDDSPVRLAAREVVRPSQLERGLDGLRPAGHRVDGRLIERQVGADLARIRLERRGREDAAVGICQGTGLGCHRLGDLAPPVADVDDDRPAGGIEVRAIVGIPDRRASARTATGGEAAAARLKTRPLTSRPSVQGSTPDGSGRSMALGLRASRRASLTYRVRVRTAAEGSSGPGRP